MSAWVMAALASIGALVSGACEPPTPVPTVMEAEVANHSGEAHVVMSIEPFDVEQIGAAFDRCVVLGGEFYWTDAPLNRYECRGVVLS